jgi:hypothetical protein
MHRINRIIVIFLALALSGCASIPLTTMARFSGFDHQDFFVLDGEQLRVKTMINHSLSIDAAKNTHLSASLEGNKGLLVFSFELQKVRVEKIPAKTGLFTNEPEYDVYYLKLTEQGILEFKRFQQHAKTGGPQKVGLSAGLDGFGPLLKYAGEDLYLSIAIKLKAEDDFVLLIDKYEAGDLR